MKRRAALASSQQRPAKRQKSQLALTQEIVKRELRKKVDWKYTDVSFTGNTTSSGTVVSLFANLSRGDNGFDHFEGNIINPQAITLKYYCTTQQTYNSVRVFIFQWFDASTPTLSGILGTVSVATNVIAPTNTSNKPIMKVLYDRTHTFAPSAGDAAVVGYGVVDTQTVYIPGKRLKQVKFNSTTTAVQDGNIYILHLSDDSLTSYPQLTYFSRVTFSD